MESPARAPRVECDLRSCCNPKNSELLGEQESCRNGDDEVMWMDDGMRIVETGSPSYSPPAEASRLSSILNKHLGPVLGLVGPFSILMFQPKLEIATPKTKINKTLYWKKNNNNNFRSGGPV